MRVKALNSWGIYGECERGRKKITKGRTESEGVLLKDTKLDPQRV